VCAVSALLQRLCHLRGPLADCVNWQATRGIFLRISTELRRPVIHLPPVFVTPNYMPQAIEVQLIEIFVTGTNRCAWDVRIISGVQCLSSACYQQADAMQVQSYERAPMIDSQNAQPRKLSSHHKLYNCPLNGRKRFHGLLEAALLRFGSSLKYAVRTLWKPILRQDYRQGLQKPNVVVTMSEILILHEQAWADSLSPRSYTNDSIIDSARLGNFKRSVRIM